MCNVLKFFGAIIGFLMLAMVGMSYAQPLGCYDPPAPSPCPPVNVTCQCECGGIAELPGLWEMSIKHKKQCGVIQVVYGVLMLNGEILSVNQLKTAEKVESCE